MKLPWEPLVTIVRSSLPELTASGVIAVVDGQGRTLAAAGDVNQPMWGRSCLKPYQLLSHYLVLKEHYPALGPQHFAIMESSHNGEDIHLRLLREIEAIGGVGESALQCPPRLSASADKRREQQLAGTQPSPLFNGCSGKHFGFLMAVKATGGDLSTYLNPDAPHFLPLRRLMAWLLKRPGHEFATTVDGCRLPNYALSAREMALIYCRLKTGVAERELAEAPPELRETLARVGELGELMRRYPELIGGAGRFDTRIMSGEFAPGQLSLIAKDGADGLLSVGVGPTERYAHGLGILIKVASGYDMRFMEILLKAVLEQLGLRARAEEADERDRHISTTLHFQVAAHHFVPEAGGAPAPPGAV